MKYNFGVVVPMANESADFFLFINSISEVLQKIGSGKVYFIVDRVSKDNTKELCESISTNDDRFTTLWCPENKNVVDAYIAGFRAALLNNHDYIIEMDAGMSHDPRALPMFLRVLNEGNECAFGSRFINGGSIYDSSWRRTVLSKLGTTLSNVLLGTNLHDATSGYQGFHSEIVQRLVDYRLKSEAHFYQTEVRYLLRESRFTEVPIHYRAPSPRVSRGAILNSISVLLFYFRLRIQGKSPIIR